MNEGGTIRKLEETSIKEELEGKGSEVLRYREWKLKRRILKRHNSGDSR